MDIQDIDKSIEIQAGLSQVAIPEFEAIIVHRKVTILDANQAVATMFGYELAELITLTLLDLIQPEARSIVLKNTLIHYQKPYQVLGLKKDGSTFPLEIFHDTIVYHDHNVQVTAFQANPDNQQIDQVLAMLRQSKQQLEEKVRESTTQLRFLNERLRLELDERAEMEAKLRIQARQQASVAELGQRALVGTSLPMLLTEATALVRQTLEVDNVAFLEFVPDRNILLLRAGAGWRAGLVAQAALPLNNDTPAGHCFLAEEAVIVEDIPLEEQFKAAGFLHEQQMVSGIWLVVRGSSQPAGVLEVCATKRRPFSEDDRHFLRAVANILAMAIDRHHAETQIRESLKQKELLLREIHHRVKNNLQVISSLLELQLEYIPDRATQQVFKDSQHRIRAMALLHQELYNSANLAGVEMAHYIRDLVSYLTRFYNAPQRGIIFETHIDDVSLEIDRAVPFGLLLNELISNALKHAFPGNRAGTIRIELTATDRKQLILTVSDNGIGFPAGVDIQQPTSMGLQLVNGLAKQLDGSLELNRKESASFKLVIAQE
jgi:PAS domain S-box-containing protein